MRIAAFVQNMASIVFSRSDRRFAKDVMREIGVSQESPKRMLREVSDRAGFRQSIADPSDDNSDMLK